MQSTSYLHHPDYKEPAALQELIRAIDKTLIEADKRYTETANYDYLDIEFTINIGGQSIAFVLGGPQCQALNDFVTCIADENSYVINRQGNTVTE